MADLHADVPHESEKPFEFGLPHVRFALGQQDHDVNVRAQIQFAPAIAANGE
jgi:hypothetical protein